MIEIIKEGLEYTFNFISSFENPYMQLGLWVILIIGVGASAIFFIKKWFDFRTHTKLIEYINAKEKVFYASRNE